jgi:HemX protein
MLEDIVISARDALAIGASIYLSAFVFGIIALLIRKPYPRTAMFALLTGGFLFQTLGLNLRGAEIKGCPLGNIFEISQFIAWSLVLLYFLIGPAFKLRLLGFFTAGLAGLLAGTALLIPNWDQPYPPGIFGGNAMFAIVALVSAMFLIQQHGLKNKQFKGLYQHLPSVQQLDLMAKRLLITGVVVLSAALIFGAVFWINHPERVPVFKLAATCFVWAGYLTVVVLRLQKRLVTRRHAIASIALFIFALASLWPVQSARDTLETEASAIQQISE